MPGVGITLPKNLAPLLAQLRTAEQELRNPERLLKAWGVTVLQAVDQNFRDQGNPKWKPLAPSTIAARRKGKGGGSPQILQDTTVLRRSFDFTTTPKRVTAFSRDPKAVFHEFGTAGPYAIRAKHGKVLAIPVGPKTLAGLGRSTPTGRGSFLFTPGPGQRIPRRFRGRVGKAVLPFSSLIFRTEVHHPGLVARPMLPRENVLVPKLIADGQAFLARVLGRGGNPRIPS